jgi:hypothetical protein
VRSNTRPVEIHTGDASQDVRARDAQRVLAAVQQCALLWGRQTGWIDLPAAGNVDIRHGLTTPTGRARTPLGWTIAGATGAAPAVFEASRTPELLTLTSAAACAVQLWIW